MHLSNELQSPTSFYERAPIRPFHITPGVIMAQMEKQFQEEETKILCITHMSIFAITILPTLDVKKKYKHTQKKTICPHQLGYSDIQKAQSLQFAFVGYVGNQGSRSYNISFPAVKDITGKFTQQLSVLKLKLVSFHN